MSKPLPPRPNLEHLKREAKQLRRSAREGNPEAIQRIAPYFKDPQNIGFSDAQLVIAREYGAESWIKLGKRVETMSVAYPNGEDPDAMVSVVIQDADVLRRHYNPDERTLLLESRPSAYSVGDRVFVLLRLFDLPDRFPFNSAVKTCTRNDRRGGALDVVLQLDGSPEAQNAHAAITSCLIR